MAQKKWSTRAADLVVDRWAKSCVKVDAPVPMRAHIAKALDVLAEALEAAEKAAESSKGYPTPLSQEIEKIRLAALNKLAGE